MCVVGGAAPRQRPRGRKCAMQSGSRAGPQQLNGARIEAGRAACQRVRVPGSDLRSSTQAGISSF